MTAVIVLHLWRHPRSVVTADVFPDPDELITEQLTTVPEGSDVLLVVPGTQADPPTAYRYNWYGARADIKFHWAGHLNAWAYEVAAVHKNQGGAQ